MFDDRAFASWSSVLVGAVGFAMLFGLAAMMSGLLFDGVFRVDRTAMSFAAAAFVGYLGVSALIRRQNGGK